MAVRVPARAIAPSGPRRDWGWQAIASRLGPGRTGSAWSWSPPTSGRRLTRCPSGSRTHILAATPSSIMETGQGDAPRRWRPIPLDGLIPLGLYGPRW